MAAVRRCSALKCWPGVASPIDLVPARAAGFAGRGGVRSTSPGGPRARSRTTRRRRCSRCCTPSSKPPRPAASIPSVNKRTYGTFESYDALFRWIHREAKRRGYGRKPTLFLADGSRTIWRLQQKYFPKAEVCLDWFHADLIRTMSLVGAGTVADLDRSLLDLPDPPGANQ